MKKYRNYLIIILYGLALTILLVGLNNVYGSKTDFINQHIVIIFLNILDKYFIKPKICYLILFLI